jgi:hypothetical protein
MDFRCCYIHLEERVPEPTKQEAELAQSFSECGEDKSNNAKSGINLKFTNVNIDKYSLDKDTEACALELKSTFSNTCILALYRALTGNFSEFLNRLESILNTMHTQKNEVVICGDININYPADNNRKTCLNILLLSYNLSSIVNFPTRIQNNFISAINNIFIDCSKLETYILTPFSDSLSDHEAQLLEILYIDLEPQNQQQQLTRKTDNHSMADFVMKLSYETWDTEFSNVDIDTKFNSFLNTYLRIFYSSFPFKKGKNTTTKNIWMTTGIKTSRKHKRELYLTRRDSHDPKLKPQKTSG